MIFRKEGSKVAFGYKPEAITYTNRYSLRTGQYHDAFIVDATSKKYQIIKVKILKFEWPYIDILFLDPNYRIDFDLSEPKQHTLDKIRDLVISALHCEGIKKKKVFVELQNAQNVAEIVDILFEGFYGTHETSKSKE